jgi:SAM-dependent methyltransferase
VSLQSKLNERLRSAGFDSLEAFLAARPGVGVVALANELGRPVVGVDIARAMLTGAQARGSGAFREVAIDLLARHIREILVNGWGRLRPNEDPDTDLEIVNISAWAVWLTQIKAADASLDERAHAVYQALKATAPEGWLPADGNDPILRRAFDEAWPSS